MWKNDPVEEIEIIMYENEEDSEGKKVIEDVREYAMRNGEVYEKQLYSNVKEIKMVVCRPKTMKPEDMPFPYRNFYFSKKLNFKS